MRNTGNNVEEVPHSMLVIVVLILSASAIAIPPSLPIFGVNNHPLRLRNERVTRLE
jgi:hypothetical protein